MPQVVVINRVTDFFPDIFSMVKKVLFLIQNVFQVIISADLGTMSSDVLKYTRADLATLTYHPVRPLDVISKEVWKFLFSNYRLGRLLKPTNCFLADRNPRGANGKA